MNYEEAFRTVLDVRSVSGDELVCLCPIHGDRTPSLWANRVKGLWTCYACGEGGSMASLYRKLGRPFAEGGRPRGDELDERFYALVSEVDQEVTARSCDCARVIRDLEPRVELLPPHTVSPADLHARTALGYTLVLTGRAEEVDKKKVSTGTEAGRCTRCKTPLILEEKYLQRYQKSLRNSSRFFTEFLESRDITTSTGSTTRVRAREELSSAELFELGWDSINRAITIPYRTDMGLLLGVVRRRLQGRPKYHYPRKFPRTENLYGSWLLTRPLSELPPLRQDLLPPGWVVLCEGSLDAIRVWQAGLPAVAMWGSQLHPKQIQILIRLGVQGVVVFTDRDSAGRQAREMAVQRLSRTSMAVRSVRYPKTYPSEYSDPGSLPESLIRARVAKAPLRWPVS